MYVIIVGGGEIGYHLAKLLLEAGHEILILEKDGARCEAIEEELGKVVMRGDGCEAAVLEEAGAERADILVAVTGDDEDNLVACQVAKHRFGVRRTIARIKNPKNETIFKILGIDFTVSSTNIILSHIEQELPAPPPLIPLLKLSGDIEILAVKIPENSPIEGRKLKDIKLPPDSLICLLVKGDKPYLPDGDIRLDRGDEVVIVGRAMDEERIRRVLTGE